MKTQTPKQQDEVSKEIKEAYRILQETFHLNQPESYLMPVALYNEIMKKMAYFERALTNARESRDMWKNKYEEKQ